MPNNKRFSFVERTRFFIIENYKTVYTEIPKVACTSFKVWMTDLLKIDFDINKWENIHDHNFPMKTGYDMLREYPDYFKFGFVRNPWDRILSCWLSKIKTPDYDDGKNWKKGVENNLWRYGDMFWSGMSFNDFIYSVIKIPNPDSDAHFRSQYTFFYDKDNKTVLDFTGRFENFNNDFIYVCNKIGSSVTDPPHVHKQNRTHYRDYYDSRTKKLVEERYPYDIKLFNYKF